MYRVVRKKTIRTKAENGKEKMRRGEILCGPHPYVVIKEGAKE